VLMSGSCNQSPPLQDRKLCTPALEAQPSRQKTPLTVSLMQCNHPLQCWLCCDPTHNSATPSLSHDSQIRKPRSPSSPSANRPVASHPCCWLCPQSGADLRDQAVAAAPQVHICLLLGLTHCPGPVQSQHKSSRNEIHDPAKMLWYISLNALTGSCCFVLHLASATTFSFLAQLQGAQIVLVSQSSQGQRETKSVQLCHLQHP
jgi:hypothetical protein